MLKKVRALVSTLSMYVHIQDINHKRPHEFTYVKCPEWLVFCKDGSEAGKQLQYTASLGVRDGLKLVVVMVDSWFLWCVDYISKAITHTRTHTHRTHTLQVSEG